MENTKINYANLSKNNPTVAPDGITSDSSVEQIVETEIKTYSNEVTEISKDKLGRLRVNVRSLSLRVQPESDARLVDPAGPGGGILLNGVVVEVLEIVNSKWVKIKDGNRIGYIMKEYTLEV